MAGSNFAMLVQRKAARFLGTSVEVLQDNYGAHHPDFTHGTANAITSKSRPVSVG
jgi:hypothetical protein